MNPDTQQKPPLFPPFLCERERVDMTAVMMDCVDVDVEGMARGGCVVCVVEGSGGRERICMRGKGES